MVKQVAMAAAIAAVLLGSGSLRAATLVVDDDGRDCAGAAYQTINAALGAARDGDFIAICAGTYAEQLVVTKSVRLFGKDGARPVIRPSALPSPLASVIGGRLVVAGIAVDMARVFLSDLDLDLAASNVTSCTSLLAGVHLRNASAVLNNVHVMNVRVAGGATCQSGVGVYAVQLGKWKGAHVIGTASASNVEFVRSLGPESQAELFRDSFSYYRCSLEMLSECFEKTGKPDKQQEIYEDLARTYTDYKKAVDKLQSLKKSAGSKPNP